MSEMESESSTVVRGETTGRVPQMPAKCWLCSDAPIESWSGPVVSPTDCPSCRQLSEAVRGQRIIARLQDAGTAVRLWLWPVTTEVPGSDMLIGKLAITDRAVVFGAYAEQDRFPWIGGGALV